MTRVALITTGVVEFDALHLSLGRAFPSLTFERHSLSPGQPMQGFTSNTLQHEDPLLSRLSRVGDVMLTPLAMLIDALILGVHPGRNGKPYDYAVLIDDIELANSDRPARVVDHVRRAVPLRIQAQWPSQAKRDEVTEIVRERCSFHLLSPMVESYFFGEAAALERAGRVAGRPTFVDATACDIEDFLVTDAAYVAVASSTEKRDWRHSPEVRPRHPKKYVQYLADPSLNGATAYREAVSGVAALATLDWPRVLGPAGHTKYIRSLFADLARIETPSDPALVPSDADCAEVTRPYGRMRRVLRNA